MVLLCGGGTGGGTGGSMTCFVQGTRIRAADGYRSLESLAIGDHVTARFAGVAPIRSIESFTLERTGPRREWLGHCRPVTVRRGALGEGSPHRDLCLTAAHAVFVDGFLMPIGQLMNGTSTVSEVADGRDTLDFFHIELERHDVPKLACRCRASAAGAASLARACGALRCWWSTDADRSISFATGWRSADCCSHMQHSRDIPPPSS